MSGAQESLLPYESSKLNLFILLILSIIFIAVSLHTGDKENLILAAPTLFLTLIAFHRKNRIYIPPLFIALLAISMTLLQVAKTVQGDDMIVASIANFILGAFTGVLGLLIILTMIMSSPEIEGRLPFFISFSAFSIGIALTLILSIITFLVNTFYGSKNADSESLIVGLMFSILGSMFTTSLYYLNRHNGLFVHTVNKFLSGNADNFGIEERVRNLVLEQIRAGESSKLEFKSTLRTNLNTGEKDPRMEKAVLKTIVAFLNSKGGTLLIGVSDDGSILGVDLDSFENSRDKFGLHLNHLITSQIGSEFLPFISYAFVDIDKKPVMRVICIESDRPVFLREGKVDTFFVRSGPSTIDLHGMDLLYYANHNFGKSLKKHKG